MSHIVSIKQVSSKQADGLQRLHTADNVASGQKIWTKDHRRRGLSHHPQSLFFSWAIEAPTYYIVAWAHP